MTEPAAVTGVGMVTPLGVGARQTWEALIKGRSGIRRISRFDPSLFSCQVGGEVTEIVGPSEREVAGYHPGSFRLVEYAFAAADEAIAESRIEPSSLGPRFGLVVATHGIRLSLEEFGPDTLLALGEDEARRIFDIQAIPYVSRTLARAYGTGGPVFGLTTACSSGAMAVLEGCRLLAARRVDAVLVGGVDAVINETELMAFCALGVLSTHNADPASASRPFDQTRSGFVMSEGACFLMLERVSDARDRGAYCHGVVSGSSATVYGGHITASCPDGSSQADCIRRALRRAGRDPGDIDYVNAHGTGTPDNDVAETLAIRRALGSRADRVPVSSTKGATGHLIAAAGTAEIAFSLFAIRESVAPPTINLRFRDPACDLDYVPLEARAMSARMAISNSFGLGGTNVVSVVEGVE